MTNNNEWKPDEKFLGYLERYLTRIESLDMVLPASDSLRGMTVGEFLGLDENLNPEMIYLKNNFDLSSFIVEEEVSVRKSLELMRTGDTAFGVIMYDIAYYGGWQNWPGFIDG